MLKLVYRLEARASDSKHRGPVLGVGKYFLWVNFLEGV